MSGWWRDAGLAASVVWMVLLGWASWRQWELTEQVRDAEWAKTLAVAAEYGWPPYTVLPGLSRSAELAWRETYLQAGLHCHLHTWPDGRSEWLYVQPEGEQW